MKISLALLAINAALHFCGLMMQSTYGNLIAAAAVVGVAVNAVRVANAGKGK